MSVIGERIRKVREELGMTRNQLAEKAGISTSMLYYYEKEQKNPSAEVLARICEALDISADYILGLIDEEKPLSFIRLELTKPEEHEDIIEEIANVLKESDIAEKLLQIIQRRTKKN